MPCLSKEVVFNEYVIMDNSDLIIANKYGVDRTTVCKLRHDYNISTKPSSGRIGELLVIDVLKELGGNIIDMNKADKTSPFDILFNNKKLEVKTARISDGNAFRFQLANKPECKIINTSKTKTGRTLKKYRETCDAFVFVCVDDVVTYYIVPTVDIHIDQQSVCVVIGGKYELYKNRWDFITRH